KMTKIIPRDLIKHLEWKPGQATAPIVNPPVQPSAQPQNTSFPNLPSESFLFSYDGKHKDFFQELITKANAVYSGTGAEIPAGTSGEIQGHLIKRMGLISTIANDSNLRSVGLYPITATQSEYLLKEGKLTNPGDNWEDFGMVLYDRSKKGYNPKEAQALYESLKKHRQYLNLSQSDLENKLIVVNAGAEVDSSMPHGVKPIIIPGITQVYQHEVLEKVGEDPNFDDYGLEGGLPLLNQLGSGSRTLYMPNETSDIGLRVLYRYRDLGLYAGSRVLADSDGVGRVNFARSATP
ncbi:MAG: hypothetical protein ABIB79_04125, partial [archaeon]